VLEEYLADLPSELGGETAFEDVHVHRFIAFVGIEEDSPSFDYQDCWHGISIIGWFPA
jgi:hypothetical protein